MCFIIIDTGHKIYRILSKRFQMLDKFVLLYMDVLGGFVHTAGDIGEDTTIDDNVVHLVLLRDSIMYHADGEPYIISSFHGCR